MHVERIPPNFLIGFRDTSNQTSSENSERKRMRIDDAASISTSDEGGRVEIPRSVYSRMYGPTVGDIVRLADTELFVRVERDFTVYGDECKFGGGKVLFKKSNDDMSIA